MFELPDNTMNNEANMETVSLILEAFYNGGKFVKLDYDDNQSYYYYVGGRDRYGVYFMEPRTEPAEPSEILSYKYCLISQLDWDKACSIIKEKGWHLLKSVTEENYGRRISYRMSKDINVFEKWEVVF